MGFITKEERINPSDGNNGILYKVFTGDNNENPGKCVIETFDKENADKVLIDVEEYGDEYEPQPEEQSPAPTPPDNSSDPGKIDKKTDTESNEGQGACTSALIAYAKTKKDKVKYEPGKEAEAEQKIKELNEKYEKDFRSKGKIIKSAIIVKIDLMDDAQRLKLKLSRPKLKQEYRLERFNSTDATKYGDRIKTTLDKELQKLTENAEQANAQKEAEQEKSAEQNDEQNVEKQNAKAKKNKEKKKKNQEAKEKKNSKQIKQVMRGDAKSIAITVGKSLDKDIVEYQNTVLEEYSKFEEQITDTCRKRGEELGAKDVDKYNKVIEASAKKIHENKQKVMQQVEVKKQALIQKAKLKLAALLGIG